MLLFCFALSGLQCPFFGADLDKLATFEAWSNTHLSCFVNLFTLK